MLIFIEQIKISMVKCMKFHFKINKMLNKMLMKAVYKYKFVILVCSLIKYCFARLLFKDTFEIPFKHYF